MAHPEPGTDTSQNADASQESSATSSERPAPKGARPRTSSRSSINNTVLGTRNLMTVAALSVVGAIIDIPLTWMSMTATAASANVVYLAAFMGLWVIPYALPIAVVRRPGAALVAGFILGLIAMVTTPAGPSAIVGSLIGGIFMELGYIVFLYRRMDERPLFLASAIFGAINGLMYALGAAGGDLSGGILLTVSVSVVSALLGAVIVMFVTRALRQAGVGIQNR